jgi:hypothetical protein
VHAEPGRGGVPHPALALIISPKADSYYRYGGLKGTKGFGRVKPRTIDYGGDPTGLVCRIDWHSWGGRVARGSGVGWYVSGNQSVGQGHPAKASKVASKLGKWTGRPAYHRLKGVDPGREQDLLWVARVFSWMSRIARSTETLRRAGLTGHVDRRSARRRRRAAVSLTVPPAGRFRS